MHRNGGQHGTDPASPTKIWPASTRRAAPPRPLAERPPARGAPWTDSNPIDVGSAAQDTGGADDTKDKQPSLDPMTHSSPFLLPLLLAAAFAGAGCERLGIKDPARIAAEKEAEGKAIGAGCRHAGRSLEDCYSLNEEAHKASVFAGWKEMNDYMAANNIAVVPPQVAQAAPEPSPSEAHAGAKGTAKQAPAEALQAAAAEPAAATPAKH